VRLDHVDRPLEALLHQEGETGPVVNHPIGWTGFVRQLEANAAGIADHAHPSVGVESPGRRVGSGQDVDGPVRERQHGSESKRAPDILVAGAYVTGIRV
jgi:hypothetical protein